MGDYLVNLASEEVQFLLLVLDKISVTGMANVLMVAKLHKKLKETGSGDSKLAGEPESK